MRHFNFMHYKKTAELWKRLYSYNNSYNLPSVFTIVVCGAYEPFYSNKGKRKYSNNFERTLWKKIIVNIIHMIHTHFYHCAFQLSILNSRRTHLSLILHVTELMCIIKRDNFYEWSLILVHHQQLKTLTMVN